MLLPRTSISYRRDIDGLRAVAVLAVILFHAGFKHFEGGFVGVDVFFVISGFLITSLLLSERDAATFSLSGFYERRARRILPALLLVSICTVPFGWLWLFPDELKRLGGSLVSVATFSSNFFFWLKTNYFSPAAEEELLLHTWSLAVEEQFYLLFPLFLMLLGPRARPRLFGPALAVAAASLAFAEWSWAHHPQANFFLLPTRAWELFAGSLLAAIWNKTQGVGRLTREFCSVLGLGLILYAVFSFDRSLPFPSVYTIVPVFGAVLTLAFATEKTLVGKVLSNRLFVGIGLISYSAYLWHQPVVAYARIVLARDFTLPERCAVVIVSLGLASLSWKGIEQPFRKRVRAGSRPFVLAGACLALVAGLGLLVQTFAEQISLAGKSPQLRQLAEWKYWSNPICEHRFPFERGRDTFWFCMLESDAAPTLLLLGNSHANDLYPGLAHNQAFDGQNVISIGTCSFSSDPPRGGNDPCVGDGIEKQHAFLDAFITTVRPQYVFLSQLYPLELTAREASALADRASKRIALLESVGAVPILVLPRPRFAVINMRACLSRPLMPARADCERPTVLAMKPFENLIPALLRLKARHPNLQFIDQAAFFCRDATCRFMRDGMPLIRADAAEHFSEYGSMLFGNYVADWAKQNLPGLLTVAGTPAVRQTGTQADASAQPAILSTEIR